MAGLLLVALLSLGFVAYATLHPQTTTLTQQQLLTNTQTQYFTQTMTSVNTVTNLATITATAGSYAVTVNPGNGYIGPGYFSWNCGYYGCNPPSLGAYGSMCQSTNQSNTVQCSGYLSEPGDGCTQLAIPYWNTDVMESQGYVYYALKNATSLPSPGSWITVTGQLGQGFTPGLNGAACPGNYINVSSVTP